MNKKEREERKQNLEVAKKQIKELVANGANFYAKVTCCECKKQYILHQVFRCYECFRFFCDKCMGKHLNMKRPSIKKLFKE